ncbi:MAG: hypothetical protein IT481_16120 [Gammaproteobacteria bacterium]|nr:hypothetical protein [Gammaproteobacteria bacterium]
MSSTSDSELRDLLLRRHPPDRAQALEERLLLEDDCAERLLAIEHDLLDDYVAGRLDAADRAAVAGLLREAPADATRLRFARALRQAAALAAQAAQVAATVAPIERARLPAREPRRLPRWLGPVGALLAAALAIVVVMPPGSVSPTAPGAEAGRDDAGTAGSVPPSSTAPAAGVPATSAPAGTSTTVLLLAERGRGSATRVVDLAADASRVRLQLELPSDERAAAVRLRDARGRETFRSAMLPAIEVGPYRLIEADIPRTAFVDGPTTVELRHAVSGESSQDEPVFEWRIGLRAPLEGALRRSPSRNLAESASEGQFHPQRRPGLLPPRG